MNNQQPFSLQINKDDAKSSVEITGTVPKEKIQEVRLSVLERLQKQKKIDGFRDGTAPIDVVERTVGSMEVWRQSTHEVIMRHFPEMIAAEKLVPLGQPQLQLLSIPDNGDVTFRISFFTIPNIQLPDYKAIVKGMPDSDIPEPATDAEVDQIVTDVRRSLYKKAHPEKEVPQDSNELPDLTDEYVQEISQQYKSVTEFLENVRSSINTEKQMQARTTYRQRILDAIIEKTEITIPEVIITEDSERAYADFEKQAEQFHTTPEQYLQEQKMTAEELKQRFKDEAKKRAEVQLILNAISAKEHIHANNEEVEKEVVRFKQRAEGMTEEQVHTYIESILTNEAVLQFLEKEREAASVDKK